MRWCSMLTACSVMVGSFGGCMQTTELRPFDASRVVLLQSEPLIEGEDIAVLTTDAGEVHMRFFPSEAPNAVRNFINLAQDGYYDGKPFYTAGDSMETNGGYALLAGAAASSRIAGKSVINGGKPFKKELSSNLWHFSGAVSVLGNKNGRGDSRFFITASREVPQRLLKEMHAARYPQEVIDLFEDRGGVPEYFLEYSIFAQVVQGQDIVDTLLSGAGEEGGPVIQRVRIIQYNASDEEGAADSAQLQTPL